MGEKGQENVVLDIFFYVDKNMCLCDLRNVMLFLWHISFKSDHPPDTYRKLSFKQKRNIAQKGWRGEKKQRGWEEHENPNEKDTNYWFFSFHASFPSLTPGHQQNEGKKQTFPYFFFTSPLTCASQELFSISHPHLESFLRKFPSRAPNQMIHDSWSRERGKEKKLMLGVENSMENELKVVEVKFEFSICTPPSNFHLKILLNH